MKKVICWWLNPDKIQGANLCLQFDTQLPKIINIFIKNWNSNAAPSRQALISIIFLSPDALRTCSQYSMVMALHSKSDPSLFIENRGWSLSALASDILSPPLKKQKYYFNHLSKDMHHTSSNINKHVVTRSLFYLSFSLSNNNLQLDSIFFLYLSYGILPYFKSSIKKNL